MARGILAAGQFPGHRGVATLGAWTTGRSRSATETVTVASDSLPS